jgi:hypothetical protein
VRRLIVASVVLVAGCGQASLTTSPPASPSQASVNRTPTPAQSPTCEIAFVSSDSSGQRIYSTDQGAAGFLTLPTGTFRPDPNGAMTQTSTGQYRTVAAPILQGGVDPDRWWDRPANRWLPVSNQQIAPDRASYVYEFGPEVHLVVIATGADRLLFRQPSGLPPIWLAYRGDGIYLSVNDNYKGPGGSVRTVPADQVGVWQLDPGGAAPRRLLTHPVAGFMSDPAIVWTVENDALVRFDLASGEKNAWFSDPGRGLQILAIDPAGKPIVWTYADGLLKIWRVDGTSVAHGFYSERYTGVPSIYGSNAQHGPLAADSHGVWFGATTGLFLYDVTGLHKVADSPGIPVGPCD